MAAPLRNETWLDPSRKAKDVLDYVIEDSSEKTIKEREAQVPVEEELSSGPKVVLESDRSQSRLLFITRNTDLLEDDSPALSHFYDMAEVFSEIHIMVLCNYKRGEPLVKRARTNIWLYSVHSSHWFFLPFSAKKVARRQLYFTDGFRPDIVVALDPFESGVAGVFIAREFDRPFQVHISEDFLDRSFKQREKGNGLRLRMAKYVLKRTQSVRVSTDLIHTKVTKKFAHVKDIQLLPRHFNIQTILRAEPSTYVREKYPRYTFVILYVGALDHQSTLFRAIDAARTVLATPRIGMVVLGDGPAKKEFQERARILGVEEQIVFETDRNKLISLLTSASLLLCTDTTSASDEVVIQAAAAGLPILAATTDMRTDLFEDGESAYLCDPKDTVEFSQKLSKFLNISTLRTQFAKNARDIIQERLHEDPRMYKIAYRDSIEGVFGTVFDKQKSSADAAEGNDAAQ